MLDTRAFLGSALIHGLVILLLVCKLPWTQRPMPFPKAIPVRLVSIGELTQSPALRHRGPPLPKTKMPTYKAAQAQPKPAQKPVPVPLPTTVTRPEVAPKSEPHKEEEKKKLLLPSLAAVTKKIKDAVIPVHQKTKPVEKVEKKAPRHDTKKLEEQKPDDKKLKEPKKTASKAAGATDNIPSPAKAQDTFSSVLQSIQQFSREAPKDAPTSEDAMPADNIGNKLSISELDALRQQLQECWYVSPDMVQDNVEVKVALEIGPDARVQKITIMNEKEGGSKKSFLAACTSVRQALKAPQCTPLKLPVDKYHEWKHCTITFSPKGTAG